MFIPSVPFNLLLGNNLKDWENGDVCVCVGAGGREEEDFPFFSYD